MNYPIALEPNAICSVNQVDASSPTINNDGEMFSKYGRTFVVGRPSQSTDRKALHDIAAAILDPEHVDAANVDVSVISFERFDLRLHKTINKLVEAYSISQVEDEVHEQETLLARVCKGECRWPEACHLRLRLPSSRHQLLRCAEA